MLTRRWGIGVALMAILVAMVWGCSDDNSTNPDNGNGGQAQGQYEVYAGFVNQESPTPGRVSDAMVFIATVERMTASDPSAKEAVVKVGDTVIPLKTAGSTDDEAIFESTTLTYAADSTYAISIEIGGKTATASLGTPSYDTDVSITAPAEGSSFTPGQAVTVTWSYTGDTPDEAVLAVLGDDEELTEVVLTGTTTTHTFSNTTTNGWAPYSEIEFLLGIGATQTWSGDMAYQGSYSYVLIDLDSVTIEPEGGATTYTVTVTPTNPEIVEGATTTVTATVTDQGGMPAPANTDVAFTVTPSGGGTFSPASAMTNASGIAQTTFTAGDGPQTVTVTATALNTSGNATIEIQAQGASGKYGFSGVLLVDDEGGFDSFATTNIDRLNSSDPGANTFTTDLNGTTLSLLTGNENSAMYYGSVSYVPGTTYTWTASNTAGTASASIQAPSWSTAVEITAPANNAEFTVGTPVVVEWAYSGDTPDSVEVAIAANDFAPGSTDHFFYQKLPGSTTQYTFPTDSWSSYDTLIVAVSLGKTAHWTGSIADPDSSAAMLVISFDVNDLYREGFGPGGGGDDWLVYFDIDQYYIPQGSSSGALVEIEDFDENPCPDGTEVTFTVDPPGAATVSPNPATTTGGEAAVTVTAVAASGSVEITATALGDDDTAGFEIGDTPQHFWYINSVPNAADPPLSALPVDGTCRVELSIEDQLSSERYPDSVRLTFETAFTGHVSITPTEVTVPAGGTATITVTGLSPTTLYPEIVTIEAPEVSEDIIPTGGFFVTVIE